MSFNPCFNGTTSATMDVVTDEEAKDVSFNPCFNGTTSATYDYNIIKITTSFSFQSLF